MNQIRVFAIALGLLLTTSIVQAQSGFIRGQLRYVNDSSGFCPTGNTCTGWNFLASQTTRPDGDAVRWTKVVLKNSAGSIIGQGSTTGGGEYNIAWTGGPVTNARLEWWGEDVDGGFLLEAAATPFFCSPITLTSGSTSGSPQIIGNCLWGRHDHINAANNASDTFTAFLGSSILANDFHGLRIRMDAGGECPTGCARWHENSGNGRVYIPTGDGFDRLARISHEMGHIASHNGSRDRHFSWESDDSNAFETDRDGSGWSNTSQEYFGTATNESVATFLGAHATYQPSATSPEPLQCRTTSGACSNTASTRLETEPTCTSGAQRQHQNVVRWLWDLTDSRADTCSGAGTSMTDNTALSLGGFVNALRAFPNGRSNHQKSEHVCCITVFFDIDCYTCDSEIGRTSDDYQFNLPAGTQDLRTCNCANH